jgi:hypothetical protein
MNKAQEFRSIADKLNAEQKQIQLQEFEKAFFAKGQAAAKAKKYSFTFCLGEAFPLVTSTDLENFAKQHGFKCERQSSDPRDCGGMWEDDIFAIYFSEA